MFYIFTCHELDIIKRAVKIEGNDDIFELMQKLKSLNLTLKEYFDSLSDDKIFESNSFEDISDTHIITKFEDKIKNNYIEFNTIFNADNREIDLLQKHHYLMISKKNLESIKKIPLVIKYIDENNNIVKENQLLYCYEAEYNKQTQCFVVKNQCWFNKYFNFFNFNNIEDHHISRFIRESLSFNYNVLSSGYNKDINDFYEENIIKLKDDIALTAYCRNTNKDISTYLDMFNTKYSNLEYAEFLGSVVKYNINNAYNNTCFESKTCVYIFKDILLTNTSLRYDVFRTLFNLDFLYSINKIVDFFNNLFIEEKKIKEESEKSNSKKSKKTSKSNTKKSSTSLSLGYEVSKNYIESILNTIIDLHKDLGYDNSDKDKYVDILNNLETIKEADEVIEKDDINVIVEDFVIDTQISLPDNTITNDKKEDKNKNKNKNIDNQLSLF